MQKKTSEGTYNHPQVFSILQCLYTVVSETCSFCRSRNIVAPCTKLRRAKYLRPVEPSRQIPTAIAAAIHPNEVHLLQSLHVSKGFGGPLIKILSSEFGPSINSLPLRHALLALSASTLPAAQYQQQSSYHNTQAYMRLNQNLRNPNSLTAADICTAHVLMVTAAATKSTRELAIHIKGFMAMWTYLSSKGPLSELLSLLGPFFFDSILLCQFVCTAKEDSVPFISTCDFVNDDFSRRSSGFRQRFKYMKHLSEWQPSSRLFQSAYSVCHTLILNIIRIITFFLSDSSSHVSHLMSNMKLVQVELEDKELQQVLRQNEGLVLEQKSYEILSRIVDASPIVIQDLSAAFKVVSKGMVTMSRSDNGMAISYLADMNDILVWMREAIRGMINDTFLKLAPMLCENAI